MKNKISDIVISCVADDIKDKCKVENTKKGFNIMLYTNTLLGVKLDEKNKYILYFRWNDDLIKQFPEDIDLKVKYDTNPKNNEKIPVYNIYVEKDENKLLEVVNKLKSAIITQQEWIFENHPADMPFGNCGFYYECSICKSCFMYEKDRPFYKGCLYKNNLENGKIFYGPLKADGIKYYNEWNEKEIAIIPSEFTNKKIAFSNISPDEYLTPYMKSLGIEKIYESVDSQTNLLVYDKENQTEAFNKATLYGIQKKNYYDFSCDILIEYTHIDKQIIKAIIDEYVEQIRNKFSAKNDEEEKRNRIVINAYKTLLDVKLNKEEKENELKKLYNLIKNN